MISHAATAHHSVRDGLSPKREHCSLSREPICSAPLPSGKFFGSSRGTAISASLGGLQTPYCGSQVIAGRASIASSRNPAGVVRFITDGAAKVSRGGSNNASSASGSSPQRGHWGRSGGSVQVYTCAEPCVSSGKLIFDTPRAYRESSVESAKALCDNRVEVCCLPDSDTCKKHESDGVSAKSDDTSGILGDAVIASQVDTMGCEASHCHGLPTPKGQTGANDGDHADKSVAAAACIAITRGSRSRGGSGRQGGTSTSNSTSKGQRSMCARSSSCTIEAADAICGGNAGDDCQSPRDTLPGKRQASPPGHRPRGFSGGSVVSAAAGTPSNQTRGGRVRSSVGGGTVSSAASATPSPASQTRGAQSTASGNNPHTVSRAQSAQDISDVSKVPEIQTTSNTPSSRTHHVAKEQAARSHSVPHKYRLEQRQQASPMADTSRQSTRTSSSHNKQQLHGRAPSAPVPSPPPTRQSHHSPGASLRTTFAATRQQNVRPADTSNKCKLTLLNFLRGTGVDVLGRRFEDIMEWDFRRLERSHDYIQWLFPTDEPSRFNVRAPVLTPDLVITIRKDLAIVASIRRAFGRFCSFLGFELVLHDKHMQDADQPRVVVRQAPFFHERVADCWEVGFTGIGFNHNWLRISRVLHCLRLVGLVEEAAAFLACLEQMPELGIRCGSALVHWRKRACTEAEVATAVDVDLD